MSSNTISTTTPAIDLEETAELPQLPPAVQTEALTNTDSWRAQVQVEDATQTLPTLSPRGRAAAAEPFDRTQHEAEIGALRSDLASVNESRSQLEHDLQSLGGNLRELEAMLNRKSEQLSVYEREVGQRDRRIAEFEARVAQLESELAVRQAQYETELATRQARYDAEHASAERQRSELQTELSTVRTNYDAARTRNESQEAELSTLRAERNLLKQRAAAAEFDLAQWRARGERYRETLQSLEGRRGLYDNMLAEREAQISSLEQAVNDRERSAGAREEDLRTAVRGQEDRVRELDAQRMRAEGALTAGRERIAALEAEVRLQQEAVRTQRAQAEARESELNTTLQQERQRNSELDEQRRRAETDAAGARERISALEGDTRQQGDTITTLRDQSKVREQELSVALQAERERAGGLEAARAAAVADAVAARERVATLEAEVKEQAESLRDLRVQFGAVRESLAQRNALIERVEAEAASSVAMLGNIQQNLEHLGAEEQAHLLTRTDGEKVVHLLGRRTTLGRTPDNDVRIDAEFISRHHAVALRAGAKTVIEDLNSTNGTYVNGQRVNRRTLKDGDVVTLGKTDFRYSISKVAGASKPSA